MMEGGALEPLAPPARGAAFKVTWLQEERFVVCASLGAALLVLSGAHLSGAAHVFF